MFTASKTALSAALSLSGDIVERRNTMPILANVLIERGAAGLTARVSDLDIEAMITFSADTTMDFQPFTVPANLLRDIVKKMADGADIRLDAKDQQLNAVIIKSGRSKFELQVLPQSDFPTLDAGEMPFRLELDAAGLARAIASVRFAISTEETRYYLNGIFLHACEGGVMLVATDGHRLSKRFLAAPDRPEAMPGIIIPKKTVETIAKILPKDGTVSLHVSDAKIRMFAGHVVLTSKLIDGTFPDYARVVPAPSDRAVEVEGDALAKAIDRVSSLAGERGRAIRFQFADGTLKLSVNNPDTGNAEDELSFDGETENIEIGFNAKYVTEVLNHLADGTIRIEITDAGSPAILRADGDHKDNLIVLMPMRV